MTQSFGFLDPVNFPRAYDVVLMGGVQSPGLAVVTEPKRASEWDIKRGKGQKGATLTYVGGTPAEFSVEIQMWLPEHFAAWPFFKQQLDYDPSKKTLQAVNVYHPSLADLGITSVVAKSIRGIQMKSPGLWAVVIELIEFLPSLATSVGTPNTSRDNGLQGLVDSAGKREAGAPAGETPDPITDDLVKQIKALNAEAEK